MNAETALLYPCHGSPVAIAQKALQYEVIATEPIPEGYKILDIYGRATKVPTMYSVQVGRNAHVDLHDQATLDAHPERYIWRYLNHRCEPNSVIRNRQLFALENISPGTEITFNYNANEYEMANPFECWCPAHNGASGVIIRGYKYLSQTERFALRGVVAPHVLEAAGQAD